MFANYDIGLDLGTASVLVYVKGKGIVLREPSVVAIDKNTGKALAFGTEAQNMIGRTPANIIAVRPLRDSDISDYGITMRMIKEYIDNLKINEVQRMIRAGKTSISEISDLLGFSHPNNLGRMYKRVTGKYLSEEIQAAQIRYSLPE